MEVSEIILNKDIEFFLNASLTGDKIKAKYIIDRQENADILLSGFAISHIETTREWVGSNYGGDYENITHEFKINLLETLSSSKHFFEFLNISISNEKIKEDLITRKYLKFAMSFEDLLKTKNPLLQNFLLENFDIPKEQFKTPKENTEAPKTKRKPRS